MWRLSSKNAPQRPSRGSETQPEAAPQERVDGLPEPPAWSAPEVPVAAENSLATLTDAPPQPAVAARETPAQVDPACGLVVRALAGDAAAFGDLIDRYDEQNHLSAMERTTGFSLSITGQLQADRKVTPGVFTPDQAMPAELYIQELGKRGIRIRQSS